MGREEPYKGNYCDCASFSIGSGEPVSRLAGDSGWVQFVTNITDEAKHTFKWTYSKDDSVTVAQDCLWLDRVQWLSAEATDENDHTLTTETPVPYTWLDKYGLGRMTDFENAAELVGREFVHFKGGHYRLRGFAKDSETLETMVVYEALYGDSPSLTRYGGTGGGLWVRPAKMFFENVTRGGMTFRRFALLEETK